MLVIVSLFNLFGMVILLGAIFLLFNWMKLKELKQKTFFYVISTILINFLFWSLYAFVTSHWQSVYYEGTGGLTEKVKNLFDLFFKYPNLYDIFRLYTETIPKFTIVSIFLVLIGFIFLVKKKEDIGVRLLYYIFLFLGSLVAIINTYYFETRYTFFLFPLFLFMIIWSINRISSAISFKKIKFPAFIILLFFFLFVSEDFSPKHLFNIDNDKVNFRIGNNIMVKRHYYPRWDERSAAEIINEHEKPDDIVISNEISADYYLNKLDYFFLEYKDGDFPEQSVLNGTRERWTNAELIYRFDDLLSLLDKKNITKWVIINIMWRPRDFQAIGFFSKYKKYLYYTTVDGNILVYRINTD